MNIETHEATALNQAPITARAMAVREDELNVRQLFELLLSGRWLIIKVVLTFIVLGLLYVVLTPATYTTDGLVQAEENNSQGGASSLTDISSLLFGTPVQTEAEIQILQSRMILQQVIDHMNLQVTARPRYLPLIGAAIARRRISDAPLAPLLGLRQYAWGGEKIVVSTLDVPDSMLDVPLRLVAKADGFEVSLLDGGLKLRPGSKLLEGKIGEPVTAATPLGKITIFVRELRARPGTQFVIMHRSLQNTITDLTRQLKVGEQGKQSGVISISFSGPSPGFVVQVLNNLEEAYLRQNVERRSADAQQSLEFLNKQLPEMKSRLEAAGASLNDYQLKHGSVDVSAETQALLDEAADLQTKRLTLESQRQQALTLYTSRHPVVQALDDQLKIIDAEQQKVGSATKTLPPAQQEILRLQLDVTADTALYTNMLNSIQGLSIVKAGTVGNVRIVDRPINPVKPSGLPPVVILLLCGVLGSMFGVVAVFVQRAMLRGVDDPAEIEARFGLTTYASIPYVKEQRSLMRSTGDRAPAHRILAVLESQSMAIEALRSLRTSLHFAMLEAPNNIVMLTGPSPALGKSFVTINLGAVLALSGSRVVVVDADLRRGRLRDYVNITDKMKGLSDLVAEGLDAESIISTTPVDRLYFVDRGTSPPNPSELLLHPRFSQFLEYLSKNYDYVLIDTPPVLPVTDAAIIGALAGTTLIVLKSAEHPIPEIEQLLRRLNVAGVRVRGVLFNQVGLKSGSYGYHNYHYSYYRYDS